MWFFIHGDLGLELYFFMVDDEGGGYKGNCIWSLDTKPMLKNSSDDIILSPGYSHLCVTVVCVLLCFTKTPNCGTMH